MKNHSIEEVSTLTRPVVLAFGGNALLPDPANTAAQEERAETFGRALQKLLPKKAGMVLVHGNGPQVGMILLRIEATKDRIPSETLDILVAETQGSIGYLLCRTLRSMLPEREVAAVLTQVLVDPEDPGIRSPTKPVGPFYSAKEAKALMHKEGWSLREIPKKGWRRVVPSPRPGKIVEMHTIADAVSHGHIVIAGGGGGIPVTKIKGRLQGIEAVVDKDLTAGLLASDLCAEKFVILTDVPHVSTGFGTSQQRPIMSLDGKMARRLLDSGEFPPGSMGPKVEAALHYSMATGGRALITDLEHLDDALAGKDGTWIGRLDLGALVTTAPCN